MSSNTQNDDGDEDTRITVADGVDHQVAMVMDLNKCIGCQTCTIACKSLWTEDGGSEYMYWNNVETKPGEGYPRGWEDSGGGWQSEDHSERQTGEIPDREDYGRAWEFNHEEIMYEGSDEPLRPRDGAEWGPNWDEDEGAGEYPNSYYFYLPRICNHCTHPSCVEACPRSALYKREEDGIVLVDQDRCRGYRYCVEGCPYKKVYYNTVSKKSEKCIFCYPRIEGEGPDGETFAPACAEECPPQLRLVGFLDDEDGPIYKLVEEYEVALPLHPEFQTQPNVYYIPPFAPPQHTDEGESVDVDRIPRQYLRELFGDRVDQALDTIERERQRARQGADSELMEILQDKNPAEQYRLEVFEDD
ncbi:4Fe-4S dicluster domain-containing protein [Halomicrobium sp. HM KBTZ05]|uniref:Respiratory nitrate reductase subunit beta n=1 Tax=Halomicrobium mukohataei TaxID=57705 RepID=A0A847TXY9_9EURY|nr:4Fe-4S dicluster domain-containing protein [Halomicrobium mukohataei]NLV10862.1 respiratory nitrate reductase subunit beta [Halomicrobium mukohataei]